MKSMPRFQHVRASMDVIPITYLLRIVTCVSKDWQEVDKKNLFLEYNLFGMVWMWPAIDYPALCL